VPVKSVFNRRHEEHPVDWRLMNCKSARKMFGTAVNIAKMSEERDSARS